MKVLIPFEGLSQYNDSIHKNIQTSSCGPVTVASILHYHEKSDLGINELYRLLGTTRIGLFTWRLKKNFRRAGGDRYDIEITRSLKEVKEELQAGHPLAMKFDRYFSFRWFSKPDYFYHWVPLVGFEEKPDDIILYFHDNGKRNRPSKIRTASYNHNRKVLTFVKIKPLHRPD